MTDTTSIIQRATARLTTTAGWWEDMSPAAKKAYISTHPNSKYAGKKGSIRKTARPDPGQKNSSVKQQTQKKGKADKDHAEKLRNAAKRYHARNMKGYSTDSKEDKAGRRMIEKDLMSMNKAAEHLEKGEHKKAINLMQGLDTITRESVPTAVLNHAYREHQRSIK